MSSRGAEKARECECLQCGRGHQRSGCGRSKGPGLGWNFPTLRGQGQGRAGTQRLPSLSPPSLSFKHTLLVRFGFFPAHFTEGGWKERNWRRGVEPSFRGQLQREAGESTGEDSGCQAGSTSEAVSNPLAPVRLSVHLRTWPGLDSGLHVPTAPVFMERPSWTCPRSQDCI